MAMTSGQKGYVSVVRAMRYYESEGYLVDVVEKTGRFRLYKDLFSKMFSEHGYDAGFDLLAIHKTKKNVLIQVTTTKPKVHKPFIFFAKKYGKSIDVHQYVRKKGRGSNLLIIYNRDGTYTRSDVL